MIDVQPIAVYIDALTSEIRIAHVQDGRLIKVDYLRPSDNRRRGDIVLGRVKGAVPGLSGAFIDIGDPVEAFLPLPEKGRGAALPEGAPVSVRVHRPAMGGKGARLKLVSPDEEFQGEPPCLLAGADPIAAVATAVMDTDGELTVQGMAVWRKINAQVHETLGRTPESIGHFSDRVDLFDHMGLSAQIDDALSPRYFLPSGGCLRIHETPACISVDVDSGTATAKAGRKEMIRRTNVEAAYAIARQLRLRNLSGKIVVDFIANNNRKDGAALLKILEAETANDFSAVDVRGWSRLGFVELTRVRQGASLLEQLCIPIPVGNGTGLVKSPVTLAYESLRQALSTYNSTSGGSVTVRCPLSVAAMLHDDLASDVSEVTETAGRPLKIRGDTSMPLDRVDVYAEA